VGFAGCVMMRQRMNGQLSERPLAEIIQEISAKSHSGRLRVEQDRIKIAAYFDRGKFVYAACNLRDLRLRGYLLRTGFLTAQQLAIFADNASDLFLAEAVCAKQLLTPAVVEQAHSKLVSDVLRLALSLKQGAWDFDSRSHLNGTVNLNVDIPTLLLEAAQKMPADVAVAPEPQSAAPEADAEIAETFLQHLRGADSYYDILGVATEASPDQLKAAYYELARRYHPDRFRRESPALLARLESAFARITQAYDTLRDDSLRASYNAKLQARKKAPQLVDSTPKPADTTPGPTPTAEAAPVDAPISAAERAANDFKEGYAALEQGQRKTAAGLFASAARLMPNEARYRAYYGHMLATQENTRRAAEAELQAAIKLDPTNAEYRVMLAQLFRDLGFIIRARGEAERAVAADPNNRKARDLLRELKGV
jgi:tetratricopeptide (TPR) repeat protein